MKKKFADLSEKEQFALADIIRQENLDCVNNKSTEVVFKDSFYTLYIKRILDIIISGIALIITIPINLFLALATLIDVGTPLVFYQTRIGKKEKLFKFGKFRNMTNECNEAGALLPADQRVTKWGNFVRRTSLDELLNFWYVFKGDMSIIGPRPMPDEYLERFSKRHRSRHLVRPGLECPLHDKSVGEMTWYNRFENDVWYVENISFKTDVYMLKLLFEDALLSSRRGDRGGATEGTFLGYEKDGSILNSNSCPKKYYDKLEEV